MKLCIDCAFYKRAEDGPECTAFPNFQSPVDGWILYVKCLEQRLSTDPEDCGQEARWFKAKPPVPFS